MNRLGIMVDVSHISDEAFWDVMEVTKAPAIASHSSARHFTPGWERNMADDMIVRLAENRGLVMINFGSAFLTKEAYDYSNARRDAFREYAEQSGIDTEDEDALSKFAEQYEAEHGPFPFATLEQTLDHFDHVVELTSVDHVGIGSDYDGVGDSLPMRAAVTAMRRSGRFWEKTCCAYGAKWRKSPARCDSAPSSET
jgi:membrane dipeptidase